MFINKKTQFLSEMTHSGVLCRKSISLLALVVMVLMTSGRVHAGEMSLQLTTDGSPNYRIVIPQEATLDDEQAAAELARCLLDITGAQFEQILSDQVKQEDACIFVGMSELARTRMGKAMPQKLNGQEHVNLSNGKDIFLFGQSKRGSLDAVMLFKEKSLNYKWYSFYENPVFDRTQTLRITPMKRVQGYSIAYRALMGGFSHQFKYEHGINMTLSDRLDPKTGKPLFITRMPIDIFVHSIHRYIKPSPESAYSKSLSWQTKSDYFKTNPEYFSLNKAGKRTASMQLCFSNTQLRQELSRQILRHIEIAGEDNLITVDAADSPDGFCYCPQCKALEHKYQSPGGPLYDYLFELCDLLRKNHPEVRVATLAYRRTQTQIPPVMPEGVAFPANLFVNFAPIDDAYFADWSSTNPQIQQTYQNLKDWHKLTPHLWTWLYPNPWGSGMLMPVGNIQRIVTNMRLSHAAGSMGMFVDHNGVGTRSGWSELQIYLMIKLMQDVNCDANAVIQDFTDHHYGQAGELIRQYIDELEQCRLDMKLLPPNVSYTSAGFTDQTFPYLTAENIYRWEKYFDVMMTKTADQPLAKQHVELARRELDLAVLSRWFTMAETHPDYFSDPQTFVNRIKQANAIKPTRADSRMWPLGEQAMDDFLVVVQSGGKIKPLPEPFAAMPPQNVQQFIPTTYGRNLAKPAKILDPDAAFGYAAVVHLPDKPLQVGFFQWTSRSPAAGVEGPRLSLMPSQITPAVYEVHKLGRITVSPDCWLWFSAKSWQTHLELGDRLYEPGAANTWDAYVSIKCDGPSYGGKLDEDQVLVDRIILVAVQESDADEADKSTRP